MPHEGQISKVKFMPGNHDSYLKNIYAPLVSRFGVEIEKMRIGILRGRSAPLRIPPPKRGTRSGPHPHFTSIPFPRHPEALMVSSVRRKKVWCVKNWTRKRMPASALNGPWETTHILAYYPQNLEQVKFQNLEVVGDGLCRCKANETVVFYLFFLSFFCFFFFFFFFFPFFFFFLFFFFFFFFSGVKVLYCL